MRKLVLGIIALISVQFAFVTYMMVLQSPTELTDGAAPTQPVPRIPRLTPIYHTTSPETAVPTTEIAALQVEPVPFLRTANEHTALERSARRERLPVRHASKPAFSLASSKPTGPVEFESVVISYNRNVRTSDCDLHETPKASPRETLVAKTRKRSYLAKASPVIKKPWEWIKTVASKLN
jgi:hypothetical protein